MAKFNQIFITKICHNIIENTIKNIEKEMEKINGEIDKTKGV